MQGFTNVFSLNELLQISTFQFYLREVTQAILPVLHVYCAVY